MTKRKSIRPRIGGAVYILPNLLTTGNLFFGYFSIIKSIQGDFTWAVGAIVLAAIFDILDGRVARMTHGTSEFGVQYDSLADLVSFGLASGFLMYQYALHSLGKIGWIVCFIYVACGALRLARFNVQSSIGQASGDFTGLPIPMAAGVIASFIGFTVDPGESPFEEVLWINNLYRFITLPSFHKTFLLCIALLLAFLMVSNIAYRSHKTINSRGIKAFRILAFLVAIIGLVAYKPTLAGLVFFFFYALSGLIEWVMGWKQAKDDDEIFQSLADDHSVMEPESMSPHSKEDLERD